MAADSLTVPGLFRPLQRYVTKHQEQLLHVRLATGFSLVYIVALYLARYVLKTILKGF